MNLLKPASRLTGDEVRGTSLDVLCACLDSVSFLEEEEEKEEAEEGC